MKQFKQIIEIEKKYERSISSAQTRAQNKLITFENELREHEMQVKNEFKKELESKMNESVNSSNKERDIDIESAKTEAKKIENCANYNDAKAFVMNKIKEFGDKENV